MIRVLIERQVLKDLEKPYSEAITQMMQAIVRAPGYISGESMRDADEPNHHLIISAWDSRDAWNEWLASEARRDAMDAIQPFMAEPERITVLVPLPKSRDAIH